MDGMTATQVALTVVSGMAVGFTLGLVGGGGSLLAVPLLLYLVGWRDAHAVIGTTALAVSMTALLNLLPHWRAGTVRWRPAVVLAVPGVLGAVAGAQLGQRLPAHRLLFVFALLMLAVAAWMLRALRRPRLDADGDGCRGRACAGVGAAGLGVGMLSGTFGIGGGFLIVPALLATARMSVVQAISSSLVAVTAFGLTTAVAYAVSGQVGWVVAAVFACGGVVGGRLGARLLRRVGTRREVLAPLFATLIAGVAVYMLVLNVQALH